MPGVFLFTLAGTSTKAIKNGNVAKQGPLDFSTGFMGYRHKYILDAKYDVNSGASAGQRVHWPIRIVTEFGSGIPLVAKMLATSEVIANAQLSFARPDGKGGSAVVYTIATTGGVVSHYEEFFPTEADGYTATQTTNELVEIHFTFTSITTTWVTGGITFTDNWNNS
jgi:type VI secretion system Hcp family effector